MLPSVSEAQYRPNVVQQRPVYVAPRPVYVAPRPVFRPAPVYRAPVVQRPVYRAPVVQRPVYRPPVVRQVQRPAPVIRPVARPVIKPVAKPVQVAKPVAKYKTQGMPMIAGGGAGPKKQVGPVKPPKVGIKPQPIKPVVKAPVKTPVVGTPAGQKADYIKKMEGPLKFGQTKPKPGPVIKHGDNVRHGSAGFMKPLPNNESRIRYNRSTCGGDLLSSSCKFGGNNCCRPKWSRDCGKGYHSDSKGRCNATAQGSGGAKPGFAPPRSGAGVSGGSRPVNNTGNGSGNQFGTDRGPPTQLPGGQIIYPGQGTPSQQGGGGSGGGTECQGPGCAMR